MSDTVHIPAGTDVVVLPGVPGSIERLADGRGAYPSTTADIVKLLEVEGLTVGFVQPRDERADYILKAADVWLPVLAFTVDALANGAGDLLAGAIMSMLGRRGSKRAVLHVRVGRTDDEKTDWFEADGPADNVIDGLKLWLSSEDD